MVILALHCQFVVGHDPCPAHITCVSGHIAENIIVEMNIMKYSVKRIETERNVQANRQ